MALMRLAIHVLVLSECCHSMNAMGLCDFDEKSPIKGYWLRAITTRTKTDQVNLVSTIQEMAYPVTTDHATTPLCPPNMVYGSCTTCQGTCGDPSDCISNCHEPKTCVCNDGFLFDGDNCVPKEQCVCFIEGYDVLPVNASYVNNNCSMKCVCENGVLNCDYSYTCSKYASCTSKNGALQCYCNDGFIGDGESCIMYTDCYDAYLTGHKQDDVYTILPLGWLGKPFTVYCDMTNAGGGWTLFQRRIDGISDFYQDWRSYKDGFGSVHRGQDFWLGNEKLHHLTSQKNYTLRVDVITSDSVSKYAMFELFQISNESTKYRLSIRGYSGDAGDGMTAHDGHSFSTYDQDNDECECIHCAMKQRSGWWFGNYWCSRCFPSRCHHFHVSEGCHTHCAQSNVNGDYQGGNSENIYWFYQNNCGLTFTEMKVRPFQGE